MHVVTGALLSVVSKLSDDTRAGTHAVFSFKIFTHLNSIWYNILEVDMILLVYLYLIHIFF